MAQNHSRLTQADEAIVALGERANRSSACGRTEQAHQLRQRRGMHGMQCCCDDLKIEFDDSCV